MNTEVRVGLRRHLIRAAKAVEVIHVERTKIRLQRVVHVAQRHVHALGLHAIHVHENLRHARGEGGEHRRESRRLTAVHHHAKGCSCERIQTKVCAVLNHHLESGGAAQAAHGRRRQDEDARVAQLGIARVELTHDGLRGFARVFAIFKRFQRNEHRAGIGKIPADQQVVAGKLHRAVHAGNRARDFAGAADDLVTALQARAVGQLREDDQIAGILRRDKTRWHKLEAAPGQQQQAGINRKRDTAASDHPANRTSVAVCSAGEAFVEKEEEPAEHSIHASGKPVFLRVMTLQQNGAKCGRKRQ